MSECIKQLITDALINVILTNNLTEIINREYLSIMQERECCIWQTTIKRCPIH